GGVQPVHARLGPGDGEGAVGAGGHGHLVRIVAIARAPAGHGDLDAGGGDAVDRQLEGGVFPGDQVVGMGHRDQDQTLGGVGEDGVGRGAEGDEGLDAVRGAGGDDVGGAGGDGAREVGGGSAPALLLAVLLVGGDRKSTRLNSSHVKISYAV